MAFEWSGRDLDAPDLPVPERAHARAVLGVYREGEVVGYENVTTFVTDDVAYIVEVERSTTKLAGSDGLVAVALWTTGILRREDDGWKMAHRHADPIAAAQSVGSLAQRAI